MLGFQGLGVSGVPSASSGPVGVGPGPSGHPGPGLRELRLLRPAPGLVASPESWAQPARPLPAQSR